MNPQDRRVRRTQRLLSEALVHLMLEKGYDAISVRDITERADVAYATFYRHYNSKDDLLMQQVDSALQNLEALTTQLPGRYYLNEGVLIFEQMQHNSEFYRRLFESVTFARRLRQRLAEDAVVHIRKHLPIAANPPIPLEIVANHIAASSLALMEWWLNNRQPHSPQRMGAIYEQLVIRAAYAVLELPADTFTP